MDSFDQLSDNRLDKAKTLSLFDDKPKQRKYKETVDAFVYRSAYKQSAKSLLTSLSKNPRK